MKMQMPHSSDAVLNQSIGKRSYKISFNEIYKNLLYTYSQLL